MADDVNVNGDGDKYVAARLTLDELARVDRLARQWRMSRAAALAKLIEMGVRSVAGSGRKDSGAGLDVTE